MYIRKKDLIKRLVAVTGKDEGEFVTKTVADLSALYKRYTVEGAASLSSIREINNTRYVIERNFTGTKTPAMLIEERVINEYRNSLLKQHTEKCSI